MWACLTPLQNVSLSPYLSGGSSSLVFLFLTCCIPSLPSLSLCLYLRLSLALHSPSLCSVFLSLFFYLGAHSSPPTLEILTKRFQVSGPRASPELPAQPPHTHDYTHKKLYVRVHCHSTGQVEQTKQSDTLCSKQVWSLQRRWKMTNSDTCSKRENRRCFHISMCLFDVPCWVASFFTTVRP